MLRDKEESEELKEAKEKLRNAVTHLVKAGGSYNDIEEAISDAIAMEYNDYVYCDIHK